MTVTGKITLSFVAVFALLISLVTLNQFKEHKLEKMHSGLNDTELKINRISAELQIQILQARRSEKDFLLRKDPKYIDKVAVNVEAIRSKAKKIKSIGNASGQVEIADAADQILGLIDLYLEKFNLVGASWTKAGLNENSGYRGEFKAAQTELAAQLDEMEKSGIVLAGGKALLSEMKGAEARYLLDPTERNLQALHAVEKLFENEIQDKLESIKDLSALEKSGEILESYSISFEEILKRNAEILVLIAGLRASIHAASPFVKELLDEAKNTKNPALLKWIYRVEINMLQARRSEKDFLMRKDLKYLAKVKTAIGNLIESSNNAAKAAPKKQRAKFEKITNQINKNANKYLVSFTKVVEAWEVAGLDHKSGLQGEFRAAAHDLVKIFEEIGSRGIVMQGSLVLLLTLRKHEKDFLLRGDTKYVEKALKTKNELAEIIRKKISDLSTSTALTTAAEKFKIYSSGLEHLAEQQKIVTDSIAQLRDAIHKVDPIIVQLSDFSQSAVVEKTAQGINESDQIKKLALGITVLGSVFSIFFAGMTLRGTSKSLKKVSARVSKSRDGLKNASDEISLQSEELADLANRQLAGVHQTVSSVHEITSMIRNNAESSERGKALSQQCHSSTEAGMVEVDRMLKALEEIEQNNVEIMEHMKTSNKETMDLAGLITSIDEKTKVINDIVFQTKLLSFNASVEAARAGEQGKGFAVVAEEIGGLAAMSGTAAKEISDLLSTSRSRVESVVKNNQSKVETLSKSAQIKIENGNKSANSCLTAFKEVTRGVNEVNEAVTDIAVASREQSIGMDEVGRAVSEIQEGAQTNSDMALKTADAGRQIQEQLSRLDSVVVEVEHLVGSRSDADPYEDPIVESEPRLPTEESVADIISVSDAEEGETDRLDYPKAG